MGSKGKALQWAPTPPGRHLTLGRKAEPWRIAAHSIIKLFNYKTYTQQINKGKGKSSFLSLQSQITVALKVRYTVIVSDQSKGRKWWSLLLCLLTLFELLKIPFLEYVLNSFSLQILPLFWSLIYFVFDRDHTALSHIFFSILSFTREAGFAYANLFAWVDWMKNNSNWF